MRVIPEKKPISKSLKPRGRENYNGRTQNQVASQCMLIYRLWLTPKASVHPSPYTYVLICMPYLI